MPAACLALGSNLGDRERNLRSALEMLEARGVKVAAVSSFIDTEPVGAPPGTEHLRYLNGAACVETSLNPRALLDVLLEVERLLGRDRSREARNAPRVADLDLILYEDRVCDEEGLCLPHPRMHLRRFVLAPLAEIAPQRMHPTLQKNIAELLRALDSA
ncbi:MAG: 2-amino-4-hydroxy-6-hydroxymethyldihydropteridine diphosphokinase [Planctomycetota bacterium]|nr:2-amino-4-hydroxy-6-hydroxymethyldihydropteridine diphosphokinase [Planctomycetota bacterium]